MGVVRVDCVQACVREVQGEQHSLRLTSHTQQVSVHSTSTFLFVCVHAHFKLCPAETPLPFSLPPPPSIRSLALHSL